MSLQEQYEIENSLLKKMIKKEKSGIYILEFLNKYFETVIFDFDSICIKSNTIKFTTHTHYQLSEDSFSECNFEIKLFLQENSFTFKINYKGNIENIDNINFHIDFFQKLKDALNSIKFEDLNNAVEEYIQYGGKIILQKCVIKDLSKKIFEENNKLVLKSINKNFQQIGKEKATEIYNNLLKRKSDFNKMIVTYHYVPKDNTIVFKKGNFNIYRNEDGGHILLITHKQCSEYQFIDILSRSFYINGELASDFSFLNENDLDLVEIRENVQEFAKIYLIKDKINEF